MPPLWGLPKYRPHRATKLPPPWGYQKAGILVETKGYSKTYKGPADRHYGGKCIKACKANIMVGPADRHYGGKCIKARKADIMVGPADRHYGFHRLQKNIGLKWRLNDIEPISLFIDCILGFYRNNGS